MACISDKSVCERWPAPGAAGGHAELAPARAQGGAARRWPSLGTPRWPGPVDPKGQRQRGRDWRDCQWHQGQRQAVRVSAAN